MGSVHFLIIGGAIGELFRLNLLNNDAALVLVIVYFFVAVILVFYPINGYLADVYCGRRNVIFASLCLLIISGVSLLLVVFPIAYNSHLNTIAYFTSFIGLVIAIVGISGYGTNFIQFGLDQLLEAPSRDQALFVHWAKWCYDSFSAILHAILDLNYCKSSSSWSFHWIVGFSFVLICTCLLLLLVALSCWKHHWFHTEIKSHNPYKTVIKVLTFVWKHSYPLQRSAFTYSDDERPSRLDFAKERFGGPFSTEQVEDVKTLLRIVLILLAIGPVFSMDPLFDNVSLAAIALHVGSNQSVSQCPWELLMTNAGVLRYAATFIFFPAYIWIVFSFFHNRIPRMLNRIGSGVVLYFIGMLSVLVVDSIGHHIQKKTTASDCIFNYYRIDNNFPVFPSLDMHWSVMMPSVILLGLGPTIVTATVFEFISAQSPHSMKGFLFGIFFAIRGTFQFLGSIAAFIFGSQSIWGSSVVREYISCLSRCIVFLSAVILIDLFIFLIMARRYKHRERGDRPYDQRFTVNFYTHVIENREKDT